MIKLTPEDVAELDTKDSGLSFGTAKVDTVQELDKSDSFTFKEPTAQARHERMGVNHER